MKANPYLRWLSAHTPSIYWHDSAVRAEQLVAFENGAAGMTTNPFLVSSTLKNDRPFWADRLKTLPTDLSGEEKAERLIHLVTGFYAEALYPLYKEGVPGKGYVCAQTNPLKTGDEAYMVRQAKALSDWAPNIVVKLPATGAGIRALERCAAQGMNVAATVSFTVPQVLAVGEAVQRAHEEAARNGVKPGLAIAVMMVGRLDDYLRDVAQDSCPTVKESDIVQAGLACFKKAYSIFRLRDYETFLMPAGCRGANHITELAGARMIASVAPKIAEKLEGVTAFEKRIDVPIAEDVVERLMQMPEFVKTYREDGMTPSEFITFGSTNRTVDQFINDGWNPLTAYNL